ncbi:TIGR03364 family FAD-dependent oxidoreductase [Mucilaginibacter sp. X5P1]|uniref:TIGR03364 family FAD-dependent oxidoreductase n=1 Tax=Mucilaginibacter sp. X5P1 TaxID=2723088 RepID=UPI00161F090F|nr:TIGR03364 family FAD-dependent oxidoreductase [Mucilaginibacter sp. X5P1]MBB6139869.1 FAD dependent oxidoreductase TIGR03364 [Mucilaginibacter sp. X5P1]
MKNSTYDLIVVGSGIMGTFHAIHAARLGKSVLLTEKDQYPVNATVRNFGQVVTSGISSDMFAHAMRTAELYKEIQQEFDISVRNNGTVYISSDDDELQLTHELKERMDASGHGAVLLSAKKCLAQWPALKKEYCNGGIFFPQELSVEPDKLIYRVIEYAIGKYPNLTYKPGTAVVDCAVAGDRVEIATAYRQKFTAEKVIICNGGEFKLLFADLFKDSGIMLRKLQMVRTIPMPEVALEGNILTGLSIRRYESFQECPSFAKLTTPERYEELEKWGIHILFKKALDGSIIIGDSHEYADVNHTDDLGFGISSYINELMLKEAQNIVNFDVSKIASSWAGFYPQHSSKHVVEYDIDDRIHIRTAIGGKGMTCAAGYAEASVMKIYN